MTKITLPRLNQTGSNEFSDVSANDEAIATVVNGELDHTNLSSAAGITNAQLAGEIENSKLKSAKLTWYTPKVIATEEARSNTSFGTLTTADEISSVVLAENGLILLAYLAEVKSSVSDAGRVAIFLGSNQLKQEGATVETATEGTNFHRFSSSREGLSLGGSASQVTTGELVGGTGTKAGGFALIYAAAGTYTVAIKYKATSGSVTAKERKLWVATLG
jgi:hypothetical protein